MSVTEFVPATYEKRMALLVALLTCAMLLSFGTAYYLWTTRCAFCLPFLVLPARPHTFAVCS